MSAQEHEKYWKVNKKRLLQLLELEKAIQKSYIHLSKKEIVLASPLFEELFIKKIQDNNPLLFAYTENYGIDQTVLFVSPSPYKN